MGKAVVYIASPYSEGDTGINVRFQCDVFDRLLTDGVVLPWPPLWSHFQHVVHPRPYKDWLDYDLALIRRGTFDACLRLHAHCLKLGYMQTYSPGADREVIAFEQLGRPVFYDVPALYRWAATWEA